MLFIDCADTGFANANVRKSPKSAVEIFVIFIIINFKVVIDFVSAVSYENVSVMVFGEYVNIILNK